MGFSILKTVGTLLIFRKPIMQQVDLYFKLRIEDKLLRKEKEGFNYYVRGEYEKAILSYQEVLAVRKKNPEQQYVDIASLLASLGRVYSDQNNFRKAKEAYAEALSIAKKRIEKNATFVKNIEKTIIHISSIQQIERRHR
ncbi:MAG: tetratricopeptide repeat protein [Bacteroidota bacterium]